MQAFSAWIHICAIRLFVESILRYGLPPKFLAALMKPNQKSTARLRKVLASLFGNSGDARTPDNVKHLSTHPSARYWEACAHCLCRLWGWALLEYAEAVSMHPLKLALVMVWLVQGQASTLMEMTRAWQAWQGTLRCTHTSHSQLVSMDERTMSIGAQSVPV